MLYYDGIDLSGGTNLNKTSKLNECDICHYCYSLNKVLRFNHMYAIDTMIYMQ